MTDKLYWHIFRAERDGISVTFTAGESPMPEPLDTEFGITGLLGEGVDTAHYLGSFDHEPTQAEVDLLVSGGA